MRPLLDLARALGVTVVTSSLPHRVLGLYVPGEDRVYLERQLAPVEKRIVLGHELGHVHHGHACRVHERVEAHERLADIYAARMLIDPAEYARAEEINPDRWAIADELGVTPELIDVYRSHCLTALHGVTYARARHGARQWQHMALREHIA